MVKKYNHTSSFGLITAIIIIFLSIIISEANLDNWQIKNNISLNQKIDKKERKIEGMLNRIGRMEGRIRSLKNSFYNLLPEKPYLLINTVNNEIELMKKERLIHRGKCSTGSYILLKAYNNRRWLFKTPKGLFTVKYKLRNPIWYKPDWAYLEEGVPIPIRYTAARYEKGVLGDRALALDDTHLIHGTPFKRMLGMPVTHGCIRLGDQDLWIVYDNLVLGCSVFIF